MIRPILCLFATALFLALAVACGDEGEPPDPAADLPVVQSGEGWEMRADTDACQSFGAGAFGYSGYLLVTGDSAQQLRVDVEFDAQGLSAGMGSSTVVVETGASTAFEVGVAGQQSDSEVVDCTVSVSADSP